MVFSVSSSFKFYVQSLRPLLYTQVVSYACYYTPTAYEVCMVYSFRLFNHICMFLCIFVVVAEPKANRI